MDVAPLDIPGAYAFTPTQHGDNRGLFLEAYKAPKFAETVGHKLNLAQVNCSVSAAGVVRGIHFADVPPGQAKYVFCPSGAVLDVIADIRVGSPTFGQYETVLLDDVARRAVYLSEGLGHAFVALEDDSVVTYLCSTGYHPTREHGINPLDEELAIAWPKEDRHGNPISLIFSVKDEAAPTLAEAREQGLLPSYEAVADWLSGLKAQ